MSGHSEGNQIRADSGSDKGEKVNPYPYRERAFSQKWHVNVKTVKLSSTLEI